jgi:glutaredoxin 3
VGRKTQTRLTNAASITLPFSGASMNKKVVIYTRSGCPYCIAAKSLLAEKGVDLFELNLDNKPSVASQLFERIERDTVPQIFIGEVHVGGFDELNALEMRGALDPLLASA